MPIFKQELIEKIFAGEKTQTRRPVKAGEYAQYEAESQDDPGHIVAVYDANHRQRYRVGRDYAIVPGRGKHSVGRFKLLSIRREYAEQISEADAKAEGLHTRNGFMSVWTEFYGNTAPECWVYEFELIEQAQPV